MMLHRNAATAAASPASGQATNADFYCSVAVVIIASAAAAAAAAGGGARPVVDRLGTDRQDHDPARRRASGGRTWASEAGWSVIGVTATGDRVLFDGEPADGLSSAGRAPPGKARADDQTQPRASATVRWPATTASSAPPGSYPPRPAKLPDRRTPGRHHGMSGCRAAKSAGTWFPLPAKAGFRVW